MKNCIPFFKWVNRHPFGRVILILSKSVFFPVSAVYDFLYQVEFVDFLKMLFSVSEFAG